MIEMRNGTTYAASEIMASGTLPAAAPLQRQIIRDEISEQRKSDLTMLTISPMQKHLKMQPGEEKEFTVKICNFGGYIMEVKPHVELLSGENFLDQGHITMTPSEGTIKSGEKQEYTVKVSISRDAPTGLYCAIIDFTNEISNPIQGLSSRVASQTVYTHGIDLSVDVQSEPRVRILRPNPYNEIEAGQTYEYEITIENIGDIPVSLCPTLEELRYHGPRYIRLPVPKNWITIEAPDNVKARSKATVKVRISLEEGATGTYEFGINLNIDDPMIREQQSHVYMGLKIKT